VTNDTIVLSICAWSQAYEGDETNDNDVADAITLATRALAHSDRVTIVRAVKALWPAEALATPNEVVVPTTLNKGKRPLDPTRRPGDSRPCASTAAFVFPS
jgi:hypothetical protein